VFTVCYCCRCVVQGVVQALGKVSKQLGVDKELLVSTLQLPKAMLYSSMQYTLTQHGVLTASAWHSSVAAAGHGSSVDAHLSQRNMPGLQWCTKNQSKALFRCLYCSVCSWVVLRFAGVHTTATG
jgi:hypothetical protein